MSPVADRATRTYQIKVSIPASQQSIKLGMMAQVQFSSSTVSPRIIAPLTTLVQEKGVTSVWVVKNGTVHMAPVQIGGVSGNDIVLVSGAAPGQVVVTAGANQHKAGQKVMLMPAGAAK